MDTLTNKPIKKKYKKLFIFFFIGLNLFFVRANGFAQNQVHPKIIFRDIQGRQLFSETNSEMSPQKSCAQCHNVDWIIGHSTHHKGLLQVSCSTCHFENQKLPSDLANAHTKITRPKNENCSGCHGLVHSDKSLFSIPQNYEKIIFKNNQTTDPETNIDAFSFTQKTGSVFSYQFLSQSGLNLKSKNKLNFPFDVHAAAKVECVHCHFTRNSPAHQKNKYTGLSTLKSDPRRGLRIQDYLNRPDHRLVTASCHQCHNPMKSHTNLPRKERHFATNECQSCHISASYGPLFSMLDFTVSKQDGSPLVQYRNSKERNARGTYASLLRSKFTPYLSVERNQDKIKNKSKRKKLAPFNFISRYYWEDKNGKEIPFEIIKKSMLKNGKYLPLVLSTFDANQDKNLSNQELRLDSASKIKLMKKLLKKRGYKNAEVHGNVKEYRLNHGVLSTSFLQMECSSCHGNNNQINNDIFLSTYTPAQSMPKLETNLAQGQALEKRSDGIYLKRNIDIDDMYILGSSHISWLSHLGFVFFLLSLLAVATHGFLRWYFNKRLKPQHKKVKKEYMYTFYERLWHWTMAGSILLLLITGAEIHFTGTVNLFGLLNAVIIHNVLGFIVAINAILSLFYHVTTGKINQYFSINRNFGKETISQVFFYIYGIFKGDPHPVEKRTYRKINPLQQITYVVLLNVLLPFQIISGLLIWGIEEVPAINDFLGGLNYISPIHAFASWIFLSFIVLHVYLTTTGHTITSNIKAMITGYDMVTEKDKKFVQEQKQLMRKGSKEMIRTYWKQFQDSFKREFLNANKKTKSHKKK